MEDDYETTFASYKTVHTSAYRFDAPGSGTFVLVNGGSGTGVAASGATAGLAAFYLDPAWFTANTRSNFLRIHASCLINNTAPTVNFTAGLYPVTSPAGGAATLSATLGTVVSGSTVQFSTPAANSSGQSISGDFAAPAAGYYAFAVVVSSSSAANSVALTRCFLQYRQV